LQNSVTANSSGSCNLRGFLLIFGNFTRNNNRVNQLRNKKRFFGSDFFSSR
jgi:hypothetical protein